MSAPGFVSRNGKLIPASEACISVFNPAIYGAYGIYESLQVRNAVVFELEAHLRRLVHSAQVIELTLPAQPSAIGAWIEEVVAVQEMRDCTVRLFVVGPDNGGEPVAYVWPQPPPVYPQSFYELGVTAVTFEAYRYLPQAKSLNALASFMAQRKARAANVHEAFLYHAGCLTEGSNSNLFAVVGGEVLTPPSSEVLAGVTRDVLIRLSGENGISLRETSLPLSGVGAWQECFITSTSRHVMPVTSIDGQLVGEGRVGPVTRRLNGLFEQYFLSKVGRGQAQVT